MNQRPAATHIPERQPENGLERSPQITDDVESRSNAPVTDLPPHAVSLIAGLHRPHLLQSEWNRLRILRRLREKRICCPALR
jgi:hypothetical protein